MSEHRAAPNWRTRLADTIIPNPAPTNASTRGRLFRNRGVGMAPEGGRATVDKAIPAAMVGNQANLKATDIKLDQVNGGWVLTEAARGGPASSARRIRLCAVPSQEARTPARRYAGGQGAGRRAGYHLNLYAAGRIQPPLVAVAEQQ